MRLLHSLGDFLLAALSVVVVDVALFHFGAYYPLLQPRSHSGEVLEQERRLARSVQANPERPRIVVMGNSITANCIQEVQLETELTTAGRRFDVVNMAIGSSTARTWWMLLDNGGVAHGNVSTVILGLEPSLLQASANDTKPRDLMISKTHLEIRDAFSIAGTYPAGEMRMRAFWGAGFRTPLFREDIVQLLRNPERRHQQLEAQALAEASRPRRQNRRRRHLGSARLGEDGRLVAEELPSFLEKEPRLRANVERSLQRQRELRTGDREDGPEAIADPRQLEIFRRLVQRLNARGIEVIFAVIPRSAYPLETLDASSIEDLQRALRQHGARVAFWHDAAVIREVEVPVHYRDLFHVNAQGAKIYTRGLARFLVDHLYGQESVL